MSLWREEKGSREKGRNHTTDEVASLFKRKAEKEGLSSTSIRYVSERDERRSSFYAFYLRKGDSISCGRLAICQSPPFCPPSLSSVTLRCYKPNTWQASLRQRGEVGRMLLPQT